MWEYFEHKHFRSKCTRYLCLLAVRIYFKQKSKNRRSLGHSWGLLSPHLSKGSLTQILKEHILCHVLRENLEKWHFLLFYHPHVSARLIKINFKTCVSTWFWKGPDRLGSWKHVSGRVFCVVSSISGHFWVLSSPLLPLTASWQAAVLFRGATFEVLFCSEYKKLPRQRRHTSRKPFGWKKKFGRQVPLRRALEHEQIFVLRKLNVNQLFCPLLKKSSNQAWMQGVIACLQSIKHSWWQQGKWESFCSL